MKEETEKFAQGKYEDPRKEIENQMTRDVAEIYDTSLLVFDSLAKNNKQDLLRGLQSVMAFVKTLKQKVDSSNPKADQARILVLYISHQLDLLKEGFIAVSNKAQGKPYTPVRKEQFVNFIHAVGKVVFLMYDDLSENKFITKQSLEETTGLTKALEFNLDQIQTKTITEKLFRNLFKSFVAKIGNFFEQLLKNE